MHFWNETILFPLEALGREGNKTPQSADYRGEKQPTSAAWSFPRCPGGSLCRWLILQNRARTKPVFKESPFDCCIDFIQSALVPRSLTIVTCSLFQNSICPPCLWPCPAQLMAKSQLGQHPLADLVKQEFSASSLLTTQELINERPSVWPLVCCLLSHSGPTSQHPQSRDNHTS